MVLHFWKSACIVETGNMGRLWYECAYFWRTTRTAVKTTDLRRLHGGLLGGLLGYH